MKKFKVFNNENLTNLFSIFFIGTVLILLWMFLYFQNVFVWKHWLMISILISSLFFYLIITYSIIIYFSSKWGIYLLNKIEDNRERFIFGLEVFLATVLLICVIIFYKSFLITLIYFIIALLMLGAMPPASGWIKSFCSKKIGGKKKK